MNFSSSGIDGPWVWVANVIYLAAIILAFKQANWKELSKEPSFQHVFLGATVFVALLWQMKADITTLVCIHFLMSTTLTVMFRWPLAIIASSLALVGLCWTGKTPWYLFGVNALTTAIVPVVVSHILFQLADKKLPDNFFTLFFVGGFFTILSAAFSSGLTLMIGLWLGTNSWDFYRISSEYLLFLPMILPPEAVLNGMLLSSLMVFKPKWVKNFDYHRYFDEK